MAKRTRHIKLGLFLIIDGSHEAAWRHPDATSGQGMTFKRYVDVVTTADRNFFDFVFLADTLGITSDNLPMISRNARTECYDPIVLLSALAPFTQAVGLVATASTSYNDPYQVARRFASLDHLSDGRAGWNVVTSANRFEALNLSDDDLPPHEARYRRAREFVSVVKGLWDSWDDDAFVRDKASGMYFEPTKMHLLDHRGEFFSVRGPLNIPRSPQGHPVIVQAGSSEDGQDLAAATADVVFTAQENIEDAREFYAKLKARLQRYDRSEDDLIIMPGIFPVVGRSQSEAEDRFESLQSFLHPDVAIPFISRLGGLDLSGLTLDDMLPSVIDATNSSKSRQKLFVATAKRDSLTIRQMFMRFAGARGHLQVLGTPATIADCIEGWVSSRAADGFNVMPPLLPGSLNDFKDLVIPELQRRGLLSSAIRAGTLRERLGLRHPPDLSHIYTSDRADQGTAT
ncbi:LLM class flavin-dependent oxidoreductase [Bradyrhizobium sp. CB82]|uniref:LLM class flavin-dependent oxidoreductase n=1 Tax=Bradyrhizobium sp. CB82 TaxID=3039159 RepID=UPI0024B04B77|nr:LLM class flavin-dependent oxidoreductase [Bradyrhizobium sp. CB82]WFU40195.1 LLM class flavin-dependent oxidoreductase [Bradyrhizobium sp. CB82]